MPEVHVLQSVPPKLLLLATIRMIKRGLSLLAFAIGIGAAVAYAQNTLPPDNVPASADTVLGMLLKVGLLGLVGVCVWLAVRFSAFLSAKAEQATAGTLSAASWSLTNRVWLKAQAIAAKLYSRERILVEKILSDGKVTPEEFSVLKSRVLADLTEVVSAEIPLLGTLLGLVGEKNVHGFLEGIAAKVTQNILTGATTVPTPAPPSDTPASPA